MPSLEELSKKSCQPCSGGVPPLPPAKVAEYLKAVPGWDLGADAKSISRIYVMKDFLAAVKFIQKVADVAEADDHHPDLHLTGYRKLRIELSTHSIGGLSENDFILAAKIEGLPKELKEQKK